MPGFILYLVPAVRECAKIKFLANIRSLSHLTTYMALNKCENETLHIHTKIKASLVQMTGAILNTGLNTYITKTCPCNVYPLEPHVLAHLSRRLTGRLIVYPCSGVRPSSSVVARPSVVRRPQFQRSSPLKPLSQSNPNFMWSILGKG